MSVPAKRGGVEVQHTGGAASVPPLVEMMMSNPAMTPDLIEKMIVLQERILDQQQRQAFVEAMSAFHRDCPPVVKTKENSQFTVTRQGRKVPRRYADLEDIDRVARPVASNHGLSWKWDTRVDGDMMHVTCRVMHVAGHFEEATVSMPHSSNAGASPQQKYGITQTYGMRYSLVAALGITTADDDNDGNAPDPDPISESDAADLQALAEEVLDKDGMKRFFQHFRAESFEDFPSNRLSEAIRLLERKRAQG